MLHIRWKCRFQLKNAAKSMENGQNMLQTVANTVENTMENERFELKTVAHTVEMAVSSSKMLQIAWKMVRTGNPKKIPKLKKKSPNNFLPILRNLGCAFLRPCHFSLLRILGWRNSKRCERQRFGVMAVCCGADRMATKVGEAKPVIMQRLVEEIPVVGLNAWCLGTLVLGCLTTKYQNHWF